jgi:hypothetical protein
MHAFDSPVRRRTRAARRRALTALALLGASLLAVLAGPAVASAAVGSLTVTVDAGGRVTGTGIDCPGDCTDSEAWPDDQPPPRKVLTAAPQPGFRVEWTGCQVTAGRPNQCTATFDELGTEVTARFIDVEPPTIAFVAPSYADGAVLGPNSSGPLYAVEANDNVSVSRVEFRDAGTLYQTVTAPPWQSTRRPLGIRADGPYRFRATAFDAAGHETSVERTVNYDATPPVVTVQGPTYLQTTKTSTTVDWSATDLHGAALSHAECSYSRRPDPTRGIPCAWSMTVEHEAEGTWDLRLVGVDGAGNRADTWVTIVVDRTAPVAPAIGAGTPEEGGVSGSRSGRLWMVHPEMDDSVTWKCWLNDRVIPCPDGAADWSVPAGTTAVQFRATVTDRAGNEGPALVRNWTIDENPPAVAFTEGPAEGAVIPAGDVTIAWSVPDRYNPHSRCDWHDEDGTPCAQNRVTRRVTPGEYRLRVIVGDDRDLETTLVRRFTVVAAPDPDPDPGPGPGGDPGPGGGPGSGGSGGTPPGDPGVPPVLPGVGGLPNVPGGPPSGGSAAKRCVVPKVKRRTTLKAARSRLTRAGCRVKVKRVRSTSVKRGRVVGLSVKAGAKRPHRSTVTIRVSRGRR